MVLGRRTWTDVQQKHFSPSYMVNLDQFFTELTHFSVCNDHALKMHVG